MTTDGINWDEIDKSMTRRYSISHDKIIQWYKNNKATLTMRFYGKNEEGKFATDLLKMLDEINDTRTPS